MTRSPTVLKHPSRIRLTCIGLGLLCLTASQSALTQVFPPHPYKAPPIHPQAAAARAGIPMQNPAQTQVATSPKPARPTPKQEAIYQKGVSAMEKGNFAEAFCIWQPLAAAGHTEAEYSLGWMYANGYGLAVDQANAVNWWKKAAAHGHGEAQFAVAMAYVYGEGVERDRAVAVDWLTQAAEKGVEDARLIILDMAGRGIEEAEAVIKQRLTGDWSLFGPSAKVTAKRANVRSGPTTDLKILVTLEKGAEVLPLTKRGDWYRVGIIGTDTLGWLFHTLMSKPGESGKPES